MIFEFFAPPLREVLGVLRKVGERVYLNISPESHDEEIRKRYDNLVFHSDLLSWGALY